MQRIEWDKVGEKQYETGADRGVIYPMDASGLYPKGYGWNGLTGVTESPGGGESTPIYADNGIYLSLTSAETFGGTIEAYMYPKAFEACNGCAELKPGVYAGQQARAPFGLCYRTVNGNDTLNEAFGYKLHLIYNSKVSPSEKAYKGINDSPEAMTFSFPFTSTPVVLEGKKPTAIITIDSTTVDADELLAFETILYGSVTAEPRMPLPAEVITLLPSAGI